MKKYLALLSVLISAMALAISIDVDVLKSPDHTKVWTPPSTSTTLVGRDTVDNLTNKTLDKLVSTSEQSNAVATGANAVLTTPTNLLVKVTNGSLTSIDGITAPADNQIFVLKNKTGANVTINNETGVNTTYRIKTGTGANLTVANDSAIILSYSIADSRWQVIGGSGSGSGGGLSTWVTAHGYLTGDIVIQSNKIYQAQADHTSGTFATDLSGGKWTEISAPQNLTGPISSTSGVTAITSQTGTGTKFVVDTSPTIITPTISGHPTVEGVTSTGATGTGKFVFDTSPTLVTPVLGVATATSINGTTIPSSKTLQDKDTLTAKGDLYVATASATTARQAVGSNTQVLTADSSQTNGIKWADSQILSKSEVDGSDVSTIKVTAPYAQFTTTATGVRRLESGNSNLLTNPSFEHSTFDTGWTTTTGSSVVDSTYFTDGAKSFKLTSTSSGASASQTSTLNAANLKGQQMVASADVNTNDPLSQLCAIVDGVDTNCTYVPVTSTAIPFRNVVIPFIAGGTSNGIRLKSATTTSGLITYLDNAKVGQGLPLQNVSGARLIGSMTISGCSWAVNNSGSLTGLGTTTGCTYTGTGLLTSPSTIIDGFKLNQQLDAGTIMIVYRGQNTLSNLAGSGSTQIAVNDGTTTTTTIQQYGYSANTSQTFTAVSSGTFKFTYSASIPSGTTYQLYQRNVEGGTFTAASNQTWEVYYYPPDSKIYSQASQDVPWQACTFSTLAWQGLGTVTNNLLCARERGNLKIKGKFTTGTTSASLGQIPLPTNFGTISIASNIQSNSIAGTVFVENASTGVFESLLISPSATVIQHSNALINVAINPSVAVNGSAAFANSVVVSFNGEISIPIQGWQDYGVIVGSFAEVPTVPSQNNVEIFSVSYGTTNATTVCSASPCSYVKQIGSTISAFTRNSTGDYTPTFIKTYSELKCQLEASRSSTGISLKIFPLGGSCSSCNSINFRTYDTGATLADTYGTLYCQGVKQ